MTMQEDKQQQLTDTPAPAEVETESQAAAPDDTTAQDAQQGEQPQGDEKPRDEQGRFKPGLQKRIDEITRARHEAEREAAYWRAKANGQNPDAPAQSSGQAPAQAKPSADQFSDYAEYVEALTEWKADQKARAVLAERDAEQAKTAEQKAQQARAQAWTERQTAARQAMPDYDEVMLEADVQIAPHVGELILDSDIGPQLAYHLAKNPAIVERINSLSPTAAAREVGRLEASLDKPAAAPAVQNKPVSKAPPPISPVRGQAAGASFNPKTASMDEYIAHRKTQGARWAR